MNMNRLLELVWVPGKLHQAAEPESQPSTSGSSPTDPPPEEGAPCCITHDQSLGEAPDSGWLPSAPRPVPRTGRHKGVGRSEFRGFWLFGCASVFIDPLCTLWKDMWNLYNNVLFICIKV